MKLRTKVAALVSLILLSFLLLMFVGLSTLRIVSTSDNNTRVEQLFKTTFNVVTEIERYAQSGEMSEEQAKNLVQKVLRNNKYHESEYVYVADEQLNFIAAPLEPELHGTSFHEFKDGNGKSVGKILQESVNNTVNKIAKYEWTQKQPDGSIERKLSIARKTPIWGWYVGTGIGFEEVEKRFWLSAKWQVLICLFLTSGLTVILLWSTKRLLSDLGGEPKDVLSLVQNIAAGNLTTTLTKPNIRSDSIFGSIIQLSTSLKERTLEIEQVNKKLERISITDQLTGLKNRRFLLNNLQSDIELVLRKYRNNSLEIESDFIFFMIDLDHFKQVNDTYGHTAGDAVLIEIKSILEKVFRKTDYLVRWGGEEFLVIARFSNRNNAPELAERLRCAFEEYKFDIGNDNTLQKTCSIGFACFPFLRDKPDILDCELIVDIADHCLFAAKKSSRNAWVGIDNISCSEKDLFENIRGKTKSLIDAKQLKLSTSITNINDIKWS